MVYYGLSLNSKNLGGDRYLNGFLSGFVEVCVQEGSEEVFSMTFWGFKMALFVALYLIELFNMLRTSFYIFF